MVRSLAAAISAIGRIPVRDVLAMDGTPGDTEVSAKARAQAQGRRLSLRTGESLDAQTVLLVDDTWRTGWTATIAGALLREAGADAVLPLVLHQRP
jgi:ATP-dependent DNA helicase RecQ